MKLSSCAGISNRGSRRVSSALLLAPLLVLHNLLALAMTVDSFVVLPISQRTGSLARVCGQGRSATREGGEVDRKALLREAVKKAGLVAGGWGVAAAGLPQLVGAKKIINLEEARELGEKKMIEIEKAKGPLIKVRDNVKYREELVGKGPTFEKGDLVKIRYQVYKGNGDYMFSTGYGREFQDDVGDTYDFTFGRPNSIPKGAEIGMEGMRVGGKRKISVPPELGWKTSGGFPEPQTFGGKRKLLNHQNEFLQFEVEVIRSRPRKT